MKKIARKVNNKIRAQNPESLAAVERASLYNLYLIGRDNLTLKRKEKKRDKNKGKASKFMFENRIKQYNVIIIR